MTAVKDLHSDANVVLTSEALNLLDCFQDGLDEVVQQLAEDYARLRISSSSQQTKLISVEAVDVRRAGEEVLNILRQKIQSGHPSASTEDALRDMGSCLDCKSR